MSNKKYSGNNIGDYPLTIAEKVVVPSERKLLSELLSEVAGKVSDLIEKTTPVEAADITALTGDQLDALEVGDKVAKKTGTAHHLYVVSYKDAENGGLCLTYTDASVVETVSYDHLESGWAYNSTDITPLVSNTPDDAEA